jgi:AcrR family transcriptional regulator
MRITREESKRQTRAAVLSAARDVFARDGFHGATLDRVAEQAGYTKGAVYSAFDSKADLFLAVYEARVAERSTRADMAVDNWRRALGEVIEATLAAQGRALPLPAEKLAVAVMALGNGLALEQMLGEDHSDLIDVLVGAL